MSEIRICKYCGMELSEGIPHGLRECHLHAVARIAELETEKECEMRVFKDGNAWCFVLPDFQDLQVSSSVWMKEGALDKIYKELRSVRNE